MAGRPVVLDRAARCLVETAIRAEAEFRGWALLALAVQSNHVHAVVNFAGVAPEQMTQRLKSHATRELRRAGLLGPRQALWATGAGSRRYPWKTNELNGVLAYVVEGQGVTG